MDVYHHCDRCDGVGVPMGRLGRLWWHRCRSCGAEFAVKAEDYEAGDYEEAVA